MKIIEIDYLKDLISIIGTPDIKVITGVIWYCKMVTEKIVIFC